MDLMWNGTDVLYMNKYPNVRFRFKAKIFVFRILVKVIDRFYSNRNWFIAEHLADELTLKQPKHIYQPVLDLAHYGKVKHDGFNILLYAPKKKNVDFIRWLYGYDIYEILRDRLGSRVNWILVDGSQDMSIIYPIVDFYIRPNRHDGWPYMVQECKKNNIPFYWTRENPEIHIEEMYNRILMLLEGK